MTIGLARHGLNSRPDGLASEFMPKILRTLTKNFYKKIVLKIVNVKNFELKCSKNFVNLV